MFSNLTNKGEKMKQTIPLYVESANGHDTFEVPKEQIQEKVEEQLNQDKLVTLEKTDGQTELLTKSDIPTADEDEEEELDEETEGTIILSSATTKKAVMSKEEEWAAKFEETKSATSTHKAKGG